MKIYIDNKDKIVNALLYCNKTTKTELKKYLKITIIGGSSLCCHY